MLETKARRKRKRQESPTANAANFGNHSDDNTCSSFFEPEEEAAIPFRSQKIVSVEGISIPVEKQQPSPSPSGSNESNPSETSQSLVDASAADIEPNHGSKASFVRESFGRMLKYLLSWYPQESALRQPESPPEVENVNCNYR